MSSLESRSKAVQSSSQPQAAHGIARSDAEAVNAAHMRDLYKKREPIFPKRVQGRFRLLKWVLMALTLGIYYLLPWVRWDRGPNAPDQAVLVDFANGRFYFFFIEIWPSELYFVTGLLILAAVGLFLVTALFGRVWCGYFCPQTVWTDLFIAVERFFQGDRAARMRLARAPWTGQKIARVGATHTSWLLIGALTGGAWVFYFHDAPTVLPQLFTGEAPGSAYLFLGILTFTTYSLGGLMREQVCTYMCPWPRIQAAMIDDEALSVTYRRDRGEPRGHHRKGESWEGRGHCIDCNQCVAACPMGIDIRDGAQLECINCALCIDACDEIMGKLDLPRGLIAYDTDQNIERRQQGEQARFRFVRPRTIFYAVILVIVSAVMLAALLARSELELNVLKDRNPTYVLLSDGSVRNGYTVKVLNKQSEERLYRLSAEGPAGLAMGIVGLEDAAAPFLVESDGVRSLRVFLTLPAAALTGENVSVTFRLADVETGLTRTNDTVFATGGAR